jgi:5-carboxymethyl-2-hydroxymuconate isomerase
VDKLNFNIVAGYTIRIPSTDIEEWDMSAQAPDYEFSHVETSLKQLRALEKKMTLGIFIVVLL